MKRSVNLLLLIIWIVIIFVLTGYPGLESPKIKEFPIDKFHHFLLFFVYGFLAIRAMNVAVYFSTGTLIIIAAEVQQIFVPGRDFEILDMIAGAIGLMTIYAIFMLRNPRKK